MNAETAIQLRILAEQGSSDTHRLWRNATGLYYAGEVVARGPLQRVNLLRGDVVLRGGHPVHAGLCVGSADLVGIVSVPVRLLDPDGVAGLFAGIEVKTAKGTVQKHQRAWLDVIRSLGGIGRAARSPGEVKAILEEAQRVHG